MDLARVVHALSTALGPAATPDLVERAVTAVLDVLPEPAEAPDDRLWIVTAAAPGTSLLLDTLAALAALGATVGDVHQHAHPAGTVLTVEASGADADTLRTRLSDVARRHDAPLAVLRPSVAASLLGG